MDRRNLLRSTLVAAGGAAAAPAVAPGVAQAGQASAAQAGPLRVHVVMFDGVEELDFIAVVEVLGLAAAGGAAIDTALVSAQRPGRVTATHGTVIEVAHGWAPQQADLLVVPGGGYASADRPGVRREIERGLLPAKLAAAPRPGLTIAAVCTGTMLLSAAGLTTGRPCTTHHAAVEDLRAQGGLVRDARVVDDSDLVTAGGITSGLDLALWLVERSYGADLTTRIERVLEYERRGTVWHS